MDKNHRHKKSTILKMMLFDQITTAYFFAATDASVVMFTVILSPTFGT